jgi:hypothetical protein
MQRQLSTLRRDSAIKSNPGVHGLLISALNKGEAGLDRAKWKHIAACTGPDITESVQFNNALEQAKIIEKLWADMRRLCRLVLERLQIE